jgi:hypothetical protein
MNGRNTNTAGTLLDIRKHGSECAQNACALKMQARSDPQKVR